MSLLDKIPIRRERLPRPAGQAGAKPGTNPLAHVFDELINFARSRSLLMLHYCTGCGAVELPPAMTSRFDMERLRKRKRPISRTPFELADRSGSMIVDGAVLEKIRPSLR